MPRRHARTAAMRYRADSVHTNGYSTVLRADRGERAVKSKCGANRAEEGLGRMYEQNKNPPWAGFVWKGKKKMSYLLYKTSTRPIWATSLKASLKNFSFLSLPYE